MTFSWAHFQDYIEIVDECLLIDNLALFTGSPIQDFVDDNPSADIWYPWEISEPWFPFIEKCIEECNDYRSMIIQHIRTARVEAVEVLDLNEEIQRLDKLLGYLNRDLSRLMPDWYYSQMNRLIYQVNQRRSHS